MTRLREDKFYILTGKGPDAWREMTRPGVWKWYMEDQAKLVEKALSETPFIQEEEHADPTRQAAVSG